MEQRTLGYESGEFSLQEKKAVILPLFGDSAMSAQPSSGANGSNANAPRRGVVLVSGATGGVGKRVVQVNFTTTQPMHSMQ